MSLKFKHFFENILIVAFILTSACQLNEAKNKHGIVFLENRAQKLMINQSNTNDVIDIIGQPHSKSFNSGPTTMTERAE